jgi:hypothetical protein
MIAAKGHAMKRQPSIRAKAHARQAREFWEDWRQAEPTSEERRDGVTETSEAIGILAAVLYGRMNYTATHVYWARVTRIEF